MKDGKPRQWAGVYQPWGLGNEFDFLICIFEPAVNGRNSCILGTVIHKMAHAVDQAYATESVQSHGDSFRKAAKAIIRSVNTQKAKLPKPFCDVQLGKEKRQQIDISHQKQEMKPMDRV